MLICDRCGEPAKFKEFVAGKNCDLCKSCLRKYDELSKIFSELEQNFLNKKMNDSMITDIAYINKLLKE